MRPLVSIIVSSYNYASYLRQAIDSALAQTYEPIEVIVVDDGSTDASPDIIRSYGNRIRAVFRPNGGQAAAQNTGYAASSGDIVFILDSDDYLHPDAVAAVVDAWRPDTAKAHFYLEAVDAQGKKLGMRLPNIPMAQGDVRPLVQTYGYYPCPPTSGNAYARAVLERLMPMDEPTWRRGPDGFLNALSALEGRVVTIDRPLGYYRIHGRNMYAGAIDLSLIRANMRNEIDRESAIRAWFAKAGQPVPRRLCLNIPAHCKARLISLKLDPANHPVPSDRLPRLALEGLIACWRFPHLSLGKRLLGTVGFPVIALLPPRLLTPLLEPLFREERRRFLPIRVRELAGAGATAVMLAI